MTKDQQLPIRNAMENFIRRRIWDSDDLLEGFDESEINIIIDNVVRKDFNKICDYVRDVVESEAKSYMLDKPQY